MKAKTLFKFRSEVTDELRQIDAQIAALSKKRGIVAALVANCDQYAPKAKRPDSSTKNATQTVPAHAVNQKSQPVPINSHKRDSVENIQDSFRKTYRPLTVPQIVETLTKSGTPINGKYPRQNVRSTLHRRADLFENLGDGFYGLREWPAEIKHLKQAKAQ
jgi:hypothetical protein